MYWKCALVIISLIVVQNPELEARLNKIRMDLERKEYNKMVKNVGVSEKTYSLCVVSIFVK